MGLLLDYVLSRSCLIRQRQICAPVKVRVVRLVCLDWTARPLHPLDLLVRSGMLAAVCPVVDALVERLLLSQQRLGHRLVSVIAGDTLALSLRFAHSELLGDEAVFDHLVDVFFFIKRALVVQI